MRRHDWPERLSDTIVAAAGTAFQPGAHDCVLFVADCIEAQTGVDPAAAFRGRYTTEAEGWRLTGAKSMAGLAKIAGLKRVAPALGRRGDVCMAKVEGWREPVAMVVDGALLRGASGMIAPRHLMTHAWRVA